MELKYKYSESTIKPEPIQIDGETVYLRTDISEIRREDMQGASTTYWAYREATLGVEEFNRHANAILVSGQKNGDENRLAIMEAIADLYETMATLMM